MVAAAGLLLASAVVGRALIAGSNLRPDAPFVALAAGHVGQPYSDTVADVYTVTVGNFRVIQGALPTGLSLDSTTGTVQGTPLVARAVRFRVAATPATGPDIQVRASIAIFSKNESELTPGQSFEVAGPYAVATEHNNLNYTSSFDGKTLATDMTVFYPTGTPAGMLPLIVFHRGRGFDSTDYPNFLTRVASWGIVVASVSDYFSFVNDAGTPAPDPSYDGNSPGNPTLGMESGSAAQEATLDFMLGVSAQNTTDPLYQKIDPESIFIAGHSRGGGATHGSDVRNIPLRARGMIFFMPYDLRHDPDGTAPTTAPIYPIPVAMPRIPTLMFSAENDGDLSYPFADEMIDRATGPTTFVTVYGAIHDQLGDVAFADGTPTITAAVEQARIASFVVAFVKRWTNDDLSLEGMLYGNEHGTSNTVAVASWRRTSPTLLVDNFQGTLGAANLLGGTNTYASATPTLGSIYPADGVYSTMGLQQLQLTVASGGTGAANLGLGSVNRDLRRFRTFLARVEQTGSSGWNFDMWVKLTDSHGNTASVQVAAKTGASTGYLPAFVSGGPVFDRFVTLSVPLYQFARAGGAATTIDLANVVEASFIFQNVPNTGSPQVVIDDVRFE
jgi:hypothetical protein